MNDLLLEIISWVATNKNYTLYDRYSVIEKLLEFRDIPTQTKESK